MNDAELTLVAGALLVAGIGASLLAARLRLPGLVLFLALGMAIGSDGMGWIEFDDYELARTIGVIALALILFEGGLASGHLEIRPVLRPALALALPGTIVTAVITGVVASWLLDFSLLEGLLLGSILSATDGAAIFALLRRSTLRRRLARTLEAESGLNDPVAILLVLGFIEWIQSPGYGIADMAWLFVRELGIGLVVGLAVGAGAVWTFRRLNLETAGLYPVASIATAGLAYGGAAIIDGSGFLAVYLAGLALGGAHIPAKRTVTAFHEGLAWVAQITLFLTLGLLVFPSQLGDVLVEGTLIGLVVAFVARPLATALATAFERFSARERLVLGWAGLRGAIPVVLATFPVIDGVSHSLEFFNIVFFAVVISTILQGTTFEPLAQALGVTTRSPALPRPLAETGTIRALGAEVVEFVVGDDDAIAGRRVRELGLPREALVSVIVRGDEAILPRGSTRVEADDRLHLVVRKEVAKDFPKLIERWRSGPIGPGERPRRSFQGHPPIFSVRPWLPSDGDPARPDVVAGRAVVEHLRGRHDQPGSVVALEDGRYAVTGSLMIVGSAMQVRRQARKCLQQAEDETQHAWWQEVIGTLVR
ncbi:MAG TPA: potassium/proton antiporter [Solirubrobacterales bacterium]|nr:potassium/proton antiporter [Solirubrobacterales bacterium]